MDDDFNSNTAKKELHKLIDEIEIISYYYDRGYSEKVDEETGIITKIPCDKATITLLMNKKKARV